MPIDPTSDKTEIKEFKVKGKVAASDNNLPLQGVNVSINTTQGDFKTKTTEDGSYNLTFKAEVIPKTEVVTVPWRFNEKEEFKAGRLIKFNNIRPRQEGDQTIAGFEIQYLLPGTGEMIKVVEEVPTPLTTPSAIAAVSRKAKEKAINVLYEKVFDIFEEKLGREPFIEKTIEGGYEINEFPEINFDFPKFNPTFKSCIKYDNTVKSVLNIVYLEPLKKSVEKEIAQTGTVDSKTAKEVSAGGTRPMPSPQKTIMKAVNNLTDRLIPYIIGILSAFGISKVQMWINGKKNFQNTKTTCPSRAKLNAQIKKRNRIVRQLNNLYKTVDAALKAIGIALGLIKVFQIIIKVLKFLPLPTSVPPGIGVPVSLINKIRDILEAANGKIKQFSKIAGVVLTALILLRTLLKQALSMLKLADDAMQKCLEQYANEDDGSGSGDGNLFDTQIALSAELVELSNQQAEEDKSPLITNVNGFVMGIEVDPKYKVGTLDRRRAVAKDSKGIIVLRGEPSFSATDQILIDELAFYITSNNLKA